MFSFPLSRQKSCALLGVLQFALCASASLPVWSLETPAAAVTEGTITETASNEQDRQDVEKVLKGIETEWNAHNLELVMSYYSDDYLNNDGLDKKAVSALTQDFWKTYPDAKSKSETRQIRVEGPFATVESRDVATGTTAKEMPGIGTKGELTSVSEGQLYLKKAGASWRIIGDRIDYEKVRVAFGVARQVTAAFSAPEQVKAGKQYTAKLELNLPSGLTAVGSITNTQLQYPQPQPEDSWRPMNEPASDKPLLERVLLANNKNRNELLMATIGVTNTARNSLMGIAFLTRRLNVIPSMEEEPVKVVKEPSEPSTKSSLNPLEVPPKPPGPPTDDTTK